MSRERCDLDEPQLLAEIEIGLGAKQIFAGNLLLARQQLQRAHAIYESLPAVAQDVWWAGLMHQSIAVSYVSALEFEPGLRHSLSAVDAFRDAEDAKSMRVSLFFVGNLMLRTGAGEEAMAYIQQAGLGPTAEPEVAARAYGLLGLACQIVEDHAQARMYYEEAFAAARDPFEKFRIVRLAVPCHLSLEDVPAAEQLLAVADEISTQVELGVLRQTSYLLLQGQVAIGRHDYADARTVCTEALTIALDADNLLDQARAQMELAHVMFYEGDTAGCQTQLDALFGKRLPQEILGAANKLQLALYESVGQWEDAYWLSNKMHASSLFSQSHVRSLEQLYDAQEQEQALQRKNAELSALHTEKDEVFRVVAHDLKNPMSAAMITSDALQLFASEYSSDELQDRYRRIHASLLSASEIISQLTTMAEAESEDSVPEVEVVCLDELIETVVEESQPLARLKAQHLVIDVRTPILLEVDRRWVKQIVANLTSNAIKYSSSGTTITIGLSHNPAENEACIEVQDEGLGFSDDDLGQVFTKYKRLSARPTGDESSTGLGLYIAKLLAEKMNGSISIVSDGKNQGSTVAVQLPMLVVA